VQLHTSIPIEKPWNRQNSPKTSSGMPPILAVQEVAMRARSIFWLAVVTLCTACDSTPPTAPTNPPEDPSATVSSPPSGGPQQIDGTAILPGVAVEGVSEAGDPVCFPSWDATGRCRQYDLTAPANGHVRARLRWPGPSRGTLDPEVLLVAPGGGFSDYVGEWPERTATLAVTAGLTYRIVVISYVPEQAFQLVVDVQP
jgi:hypothetical protein